MEGGGGVGGVLKFVTCLVFQQKIYCVHFCGWREWVGGGGGVGGVDKIVSIINV